MKKFKKAILPVALSVSVIGLAGCSSGGTKYISSKAGDVTQKDIVESIGATQLSKTATSMMIQKVLLDKYKSKINEKTIDEQLQKAQEQYGGKEKFEQLLKQQGFTLDKYKDGLRVKAAQTYMINDYNGVNDDKLKENYEKNKHQYHLAHILISVKSKSNTNGLSDEDAKKKAEEILKKIKDGGDFATLAKENSNDTANASNGGDLGWSSKEDNSFVKEFKEAAYSLEKDQVSDVVKTSFGYHIIKVLDTKDSSFDELKPTLEEKAAEQAVKEDSTVVSKALKKIFEEYNVKANNSDVENYIKSMLEGNANSSQQNK
ncbi:foldase protein PrsA [Gemella cuniculi]|uniref:foldase protein PrsA n=1 Tax=Gemella cuniculi TaxID=150240 RepID=UPI000403AAC4|nr:peptidylprolyl isomerase [Gemella cuniculi]